MPGTINVPSNVDIVEDCETIQTAMTGMGCDKEAVINVLCHRTASQRAEIRTQFKQMFGKDLIDTAESEFRGDLEDLIVALLYSADEYDAHEMKKAVKGLGTKEATIIEILATRSNEEIGAMKDTYKRLFESMLEEDLTSDTSGDFQRLVVSLVQGARDESGDVDRDFGRKDADRLWEAGEKKFGTDESVFNSIVAAQNYNQLNFVFDSYRSLAGKEIDEAIETEFSGDVGDGLVALVKFVRMPEKYFAEKLFRSMKGMGTDDKTLVRIIVSRCEKDMSGIKTEFETEQEGNSLESVIEGDCSGDYKTALLKLIGCSE